MRNGLLDGDDLRMWRTGERLTQTEAGQWFGVAHQRISLWEHVPATLPKNFHERFIGMLIRYFPHGI